MSNHDWDGIRLVLALAQVVFSLLIYWELIKERRK